MSLNDDYSDTTTASPNADVMSMLFEVNAPRSSLISLSSLSSLSPTSPSSPTTYTPPTPPAIRLGLLPIMQMSPAEKNGIPQIIVDYTISGEPISIKDTM